jgi:hypothetical protein
MVATLCGPERWRFALVNPAPGAHRTFYLYQLIKEKFILSLCPAFEVYAIQFLFLSSTYPNPHVVLYPCAMLEARIELLGCVSVQDLSTWEERVWSSGVRLRGSVLVLYGVQSCVAA